jgi:hypothetical protein
MRWFLRGCVLTAGLVLLSVLASGCGQSNESFSDIKGQPPPPGAPKTQVEAYSQMKNAGAGLKSQGYPGAGRRR